MNIPTIISDNTATATEQVFWRKKERNCGNTWR
jgi:hypothetical protein